MDEVRWKYSLYIDFDENYCGWTNRHTFESRKHGEAGLNLEASSAYLPVP
jgi:hypothetical protein